MARTRALRRQSSQLGRFDPEELEDLLDGDPELANMIAGAMIIHRVGPGGRTPTKKARKLISAQGKSKQNGNKGKK